MRNIFTKTALRLTSCFLAIALAFPAGLARGDACCCRGGGSQEHHHEHDQDGRRAVHEEGDHHGSHVVHPPAMSNVGRAGLDAESQDEERCLCAAEVLPRQDVRWARKHTPAPDGPPDGCTPPAGWTFPVVPQGRWGFTVVQRLAHPPPALLFILFRTLLI